LYNRARGLRYATIKDRLIKDNAMNGQDRKNFSEFKEESTKRFNKLEIGQNNLQQGQEKILKNHLPALEKKISDLKWLIMLGVASIAILVALFGSLMIIGQ